MQHIKQTAETQKTRNDEITETLQSTCIIKLYLYDVKR